MQYGREKSIVFREQSVTCNMSSSFNYSIISCDSSLDFAPPSSLPVAAYLFAQLLGRHWANQCNADLMIVYIRAWNPDRIRKPFLVPIYSHPTAISPRESVLSALQGEIQHAHRLIGAEWTEINAAIPHWAMGLACGMLAVVILSIYTANCVTNKLGKGSQKQKSSVASVRKSSDRFRAGFGGGMMMNSSQQKKSVMMFRTFSKTPNRNGNINRL
uniref:PBPe domain-containing protein n=1 Tax=Heterorhabditis bacteriophora TaxID=37862 RepID=A0A1I7WXH2_HETBA